MQLGRVFGILSIWIGGIFTWLAIFTLQDSGSTLKLFTVGPGFIAIGIAMIIFPGGKITAKESRQKIKHPDVMFKEAPTSHLVSWVISGVAGFIATIMIFY